MAEQKTVRFTSDDKWGVWKTGDLADDLGRESDHPNAPDIQLLRLHRDGQMLSLTAPYARGMIETVTS